MTIETDAQLVREALLTTPNKDALSALERLLYHSRKAKDWLAQEVEVQRQRANVAEAELKRLRAELESARADAAAQCKLKESAEARLRTLEAAVDAIRAHLRLEQREKWLEHVISAIDTEQQLLEATRRRAPGFSPMFSPIESPAEVVHFLASRLESAEAKALAREIERDKARAAWAEESNARICAEAKLREVQNRALDGEPADAERVRGTPPPSGTQPFVARLGAVPPDDLSQARYVLRTITTSPALHLGDHVVVVVNHQTFKRAEALGAEKPLDIEN